MQPYQERVIEELGQLNDKRIKLAQFINTDIFQQLAEDERDTLSRQFDAMGEYARALEDRVEIWRKRGVLK